MTIVSFAHSFAFIKTAKTAGTSIEVDLSPHLGPDAIVTPIQPAVAGHAPRNFAGPDGKPLYYNHMRASELRSQLGPEVYDELLVFCVEREPVEKCISHFHMKRNSPLHNPDGKNSPSWAEYVEEGKFPNDVRRYSEPSPDGRRLIVDRILRYDALPGALTTLLNEQGLPNFQLTTRAKSEYAHNRLVSPADVTASERKRIYDAFQEASDLINIDWKT